MESEMSSIRANKTWDLVELPKNRRALPFKWVYRLKETSDLTNPKYKARLVVMEFRPTQRIWRRLRWDLFISGKNDNPSFHSRRRGSRELGADSARCKNGIPPRWPKGGNIYGAVERLCGIRSKTSSLSTGLKQAPRQWYKKFDNFMMSVGSSRAMRTTVFSPKQLKMGHPSSSSFTWTTCYSLVFMLENSWWP